MKNKYGMEPWEMFAEAKKCLGISALASIFKVGHNQLYKSMRNPDYTENYARTPFQRIRMMLHDIEKAGGQELAHAILNYMAEPLGMRCTPITKADPDREDMSGECLDDYPPLADLHTAIDSGADLREVHELAAIVKNEIDQTVTLYSGKIECGE